MKHVNSFNGRPKKKEKMAKGKGVMEQAESGTGYSLCVMQGSPRGHMSCKTDLIMALKLRWELKIRYTLLACNM